jgi:hypothetical protein
MQQAGDRLGRGHDAPVNTPGAGVLWIDAPLAGSLGAGVVAASFAATEAAARAREAEAGLWLWTPGSADGEVLAPLQAQGRATAENAWRKAFADHLAMGDLLVLCAAPDEHQLHTPEALVDSGWPHSLPVPLVTEVATAAGARCVAGEPFASFLAAHEGLFTPRPANASSTPAHCMADSRSPGTCQASAIAVSTGAR